MSATSHPPELDLLRKQVADLARELTERDQAIRHQNRQDGELQDLREQSEMLRAIMAGPAAETGEDFFQTLVLHLCSVFDVQYALVGEVQPEATRKIRTIAVSSGGSLVENFTYFLANTPCEIALTHSFACFDQDIRASFPAFERLDQLCVESYCGVPLRAKDGTVIGLLVVMDTKPLRNARRLKWLMTVFASRAGTELQRQQTEMELRHRQHHLIESQAQVHLGSWDWEIESGTVWWSDEQYRLFGHEPDTVAATHETFLKAVYPDDRGKVQDAFDAALAGRARFDMEYRIVRPNGEVRVINCRGVVFRNDGGQPVSMSGSMLDITNRKRVEEALRTSQEKLRQALQTSGTGLWDWNTDTNKVAFSEEWMRQLGYERTELSGSFETWASLLHPEDRDRAMAYVRDYLIHRKGDYRQEFRLRHKDGTYRWIEARASFVTEADGRRTRLLGSHTDITDRKQMEETVRESEERYRTLVELSPSGVFVFCEGRTGYINHTGAVLLGAKDVWEILDRPTFDFIHPDYHQEVRENVKRLLNGGVSVHSAERIYLKLDGTPIPVQVEAARIMWNGKSAILGLFSDITERKKAQEAVAALNASLERQVCDRTEALRRSEERFRQFAESVGSAFLIADCSPGAMDVIYVNAAFAFIWGIEREEICRNGSLWLDSIHPEDRVRVKTHHDRFLVGGTNAVFYCEYRIVGRDGYIRWIADRRVRMSGWENRIAGIAEDITSHKQQLALMKQTEAIGKIGGWELDIVTNRLRWSEETYRLHDTTPELYSPTVETSLNFYTPESRPRITEAIKKGITQGLSWDLELELITAMGRQVAVRAAGKIDVVNGRAVRGYGTFQDITQRKKTEEALRRAHDELERKVIERTAELQASEERYARATAIVKVGVWELDVKTGQCHGDANLKALFGYGPEELSMDPRAWLNVVYPDDQPIAMRHWGLVQSGAADECHYELRMVKKDGPTIWTDGRCHAVRDGNGRLTRLIGATVDITERKQAEQALRESEERFSKAFRTSPHPIGITEAATGRCIEVNDACLEQFGFRREEVIGRTTLMLGIWPNPLDRARLIDRLRAEGAVRNLEVSMRIRTGEFRQFLISSNLITLKGKSCILTIGNDITDRRQAEEALRLSEERFAKAFRASPHPVVISELDSGRVVDINDAACQMFGYSKEEVVEQTTLQIGLWHSAEEQARYLELLKRQGSTRNVEVKLRSRRGEVRQCLLSSELIMVNGKQCSVTVGDDITESKRMERALRLTQFSVDQAVEAILWLDPTARIFNVNDTACRMLGYSRQELTSMTVHDIDPNFPVERWAEHWSHVKERRALAFEAKYWSRSGDVLEMEVTFNYLQYDGKEYGCAILRDIGERKQAEAELRRSHTFLRQVIDTDPDLIFAKDREGRFAMANKAVADWYGTTVDDLVGKSDADFNFNADELKFFRKNDHEIMNSGRERFILEEKCTDATGRTRWLQAVKRPIFDDNGQVHMVLGAATDITERKRMEEILRQRERDLSAALQERERISQDLHDGILQSLYAVGLGLEGCKPMIRQQPEPVSTPFMSTLDQTIGQINQVMGEVRNFIAGLESHVIQGGDFPTALRTMVQTMSGSSRAKCQIRIDEAAARRLSTEQVLHIINIVREGLSNAVRHSQATRIMVSFRELVRTIRLTIRDDGIGFNTRSAQGVGHGLGNMAARAQKVGGSFALHSKPWKGAKIVLDLPKGGHYADN